MAKIQAVWALDIGQAALKALLLVPGKAPDEVVAEAFDYVEYPKLLSQPDADPDQLVREALETFLERNDLKGCKVSIAVPGQSGLVKFIKLPPVEKKRIPDIVKFEARQQIPFALEEVVWAYQQIGREEEEGDEGFTMAEVGLFAMKRDQITRAILPFTAAGIEVDIVQMGPLALYNYFTFDQLEGSDTKDPVVLLDIGADNTDLIITDGDRIWQRNVPIGGNHFTRALTKELKLTFAKAEHLKRNATKAPDPRSIFTAMRGVFNDFASEVNRSIRFYSSMNRQAKITKIVGLGNGFKLPGLQKFLQQNLSQEVEKLETFAKLSGDEVKTAPQFQENLASFAVAYGLGVQGLGKSVLRTNLLPPEVEQARLIRAKKPWVLVASALLMLGLAGLFALGDYRVLAKVDNLPFKQAVDSAKQTSKNGAEFKSQFATAKSNWEAKYNEGKTLVIDPTDRGKWPEFLRRINDNLPDPVADYHLNPNKPTAQPILDRLRVHIDAIKPAWRNDVAAEWFHLAPPIGPRDDFKNLMHPYDRANPPSGEGWIIQLVGHHYNPNPSPDQLRIKEDDPKRVEFGPYGYLIKKILPRLNSADLPMYGVTHVVLAWMTVDPEWTGAKGSQTNNLSTSTVPLLTRATAPVAATGQGGMAALMNRGPMGMSGPGGMGGPGGMSPDAMARMMMSMGGPGGMSEEAKKKMTTFTRTDFLINFVWQPSKIEERPKTPEEYTAKSNELKKLLLEAEKTQSEVRIPREQEVVKASREQSQAVDAALSKVEAAATATPPGAPGAGLPKMVPPGAGVGALPGTPPAGVGAPGAPPAAPGAPK